MIVPISPKLLLDLFTIQDEPMTIRCVEGLPPDSRFIGMGEQIEKDMYYLIFENDTWEPVPEFQTLPILNILFMQYHSAEVRL